MCRAVPERSRRHDGAFLFEVVERLEEQQPRQLWQQVELTVQPGILAHEVARLLDNRLEPGLGDDGIFLRHGWPPAVGIGWGRAARMALVVVDCCSQSARSRSIMRQSSM